VLSVEQAIAALLERADRRVGPETVRLADALGRTLAADLVAGIDVPPADNSAMDGYALRHADWSADRRPGLPVSQRITAGIAPGPLAAGTAARIFTGAELPPGADTVVMQEDCDAAESAVRIRELPAAGANVRRRGQDIRRGQRVLAAGRRLRAQDLGLTASLGVAELAVWRRLRVAVLSTGDELVEPGAAAGPGQIFNSNRFTLAAQLSLWGFEVIDLGAARDTPEAVRSALLRGAAAADVLVSAGGVSVGEEDHVKAAVDALGALDLWRVAIRPGKPFAFGRVGDRPFLGLPGNPVSVFVTLLVIARPFLFACQGVEDDPLRPLPRIAAFSQPGGSREEYLRVRDGATGLERFPNQSSGVLFSTSWADGVVRQRAGEDIRAGATVDYFPWALFS
jgi:molybdopterin molybdotransferase